ncbi:tetratricopeptide repeat protein [Streptomyces dysideae]|uniref:tetratricopeptide repeat protein n=1 Tax=Streptomyces dysideae TaxID=909626 RepID=UPI001F416E02|nr:tetratricopeptide repeat protein [Streptomyces dysideae]
MTRPTNDTAPEREPGPDVTQHNQKAGDTTNQPAPTANAERVAAVRRLAAAGSEARREGGASGKRELGGDETLNGGARDGQSPEPDAAANGHEAGRSAEPGHGQSPEPGARPDSGHDDTPPPGPETPRSPEPGAGAASTPSPKAAVSSVGAGPRVAALRRVAASSRRRGIHLAGCAALLAVAMTAGAVAVGAVRDGGGNAVASVPAAVAPGVLVGGDLDAGIDSLQAHLRDQPRDFSGWATLGLAYVEQARTNGDPSRYPQAEQAFTRSLDLGPGNDQALAGRAALAAARHDFEDALTYADQALEQNPYSERALATRVDALVELGRYADASKAADTADDRRPGVPVFARYAYVRELRGDVAGAQRVLEQALSSAFSPGDIAYIATQLGQLAWNQGDYKAALTHYARALAADENYVPALEGRARAQAAGGDRAGAIKGMENVVARYPLPGPLVVLGELYEERGADGDKAKAGDQYALVNAWTALARANGVNADLDTALAAADHGDKASALRAARAEWDRRHTVHTADAFAWALHVNGRSDEALPYAREATATGYRNASFLYHRGMIERATGHAKDAREHLQAALKLNPGFSPLGAREARTALKDLEAAE